MAMASAPVIAAFDPVDANGAPARFGATVAAVTGAQLLVASVYGGDDVADRLVGGQLGENLSSDPSDALGAIVNALRDDGVDAEPLALAATSAPRGLSLAAEQLGAGLLVVGAASGLRQDRLAPGSTTERLLGGAPCAVAVVPTGHRSRPPATVGVGYVDTAEGREAVRAAHALARRAGARLRVLSVVQPRPWMSAPGGEVELVAALRTAAEEAAHEAVAAFLGAPVDIDVEVADPGDVLVAASAEVDVLVLGSRGYGPRSATLRGGVSRRVAAEGGCPVIVVARAAEVPLQALVGDDR